MDAAKTGNLISTLRKEKGLTQKQLAKELSVSDKAVSRWETGKGFPDIETLPKIAELLNITITELLNGEVTNTVTSADPCTNENHLVDVCIAANESSARHKKKIKQLTFVLSIVITFSVIVSMFTSLFILHYQSIVGSENCVIAANYSELEYFGKTYLPIYVEKNSKISVSDIILIKEAQVNGAGYISKLPFGETIYAVNGVENNDIIYLQTESNSESKFYCIADKYEYYCKSLGLGNFAPTNCTITVAKSMLNDQEVTLSDDAVNYLRTLESESEIMLDESSIEFTANINCLDDSCLLRVCEIVLTNDGLYFSPTVTFSGHSGKHYFKINNEYGEYFKGILSEDSFYKDAVKRIEK